MAYNHLLAMFKKGAGLSARGTLHTGTSGSGLEASGLTVQGVEGICSLWIRACDPNYWILLKGPCKAATVILTTLSHGCPERYSHSKMLSKRNKQKKCKQQCLSPTKASWCFKDELQTTKSARPRAGNRGTDDRGDYCDWDPCALLSTKLKRSNVNLSQTHLPP